MPPDLRRPLTTATRLPVRSAAGSGPSRKGTMPAISTAPAGASGRRNSRAEAMLAPLENPAANQDPAATP